MNKKSPFFYGWIIAVVAFLVGLIVYGTRHSFSMFFVAILEEFQWSRGSTALMLSINILLYGISAPIAGLVADKFGIRRTLPLGAVLLGAAMASLSLANQLWQFYIVFGVIVPLATALVGFPVLAPMVTNWFAKRRGTALGVFQSGIGFSFIIGTVAEYFIVTLGWRTAYIAVGILIVIIVVPMALLFLYFKPSDKGLAADGTAGNPGQAASSLVIESVDRKWTSVDWTPGKAIKTRRFWILFSAGFLLWGGVYTIFAHQMASLVDNGFERLFAAWICGTFFGIANGIGHGAGFLSDRLGRERTYTLGVLGMISAIFILTFIKSTSPPVLIYLYPLLLGLLGGIVAPTQTTIYADLFHGKHFGAINGLLMLGFGLGAAIGPWLAGYIFDITGSYTIAFSIAIIACTTAIILIWIAAPRKVVRLRRVTAESD